MGSHTFCSSCSSSSQSQPSSPVQEVKFLMGIRQNPHYGPLRDKPKSIRDNLVSGYDRAFLETAGRIQGLASPKDLERSKAELRGSLAELEGMGYDVAALTRRLDVLDGALGPAMLDRDSTRAKIDEASRKVEEKKEELTAIREEIATLQAKADDKQQGIDELVKWVEKLRVRRPDVDTAFSKLAKAPLL